MIPSSELENIPCGWYLGRPSKFSENAKNLKHSEDSKKIKGNVCYTNGVKNVKTYPQNGEILPDGVWKGMTKTKKVKK